MTAGYFIQLFKLNLRKNSTKMQFLVYKGGKSFYIFMPILFFFVLFSLKDLAQS
jgi:hypothetical protein